MRILIDASPLAAASCEEADFFRELVRNLFARRPRHTYRILGWPHAACGDCADFLSPLPRNASSWATSGDLAGPESPGSTSLPTVVFSPLGLPERRLLGAVPPGTPALALVTRASRCGARRPHAAALPSRPAPFWALTLSRASREGVARRLGPRANRVLWIPPPAGIHSPWDTIEETALPRSRPYAVTSICEKTVRRFSVILEGFRLQGRGAGPGSDLALLVLGKAPFRARQIVWWRGLGQKVFFLGEPRRAERSRIMAAARAYISPGGGDAAWFSAGEALSVGVPVLAPEEPAITELLAGAALYHDASEPGRLAANIWRCLDSEEFTRRLARRGMERACTLSWDAFTARLLDFFSDAQRTS